MRLKLDTFARLLTVTAPIGLLLGCGAILLQKYGFQDRLGIAIGKGLLLGILTAIPTALPSLGMIPLAAIGAIKLLSDKSLSSDENAKQLASMSVK